MPDLNTTTELCRALGDPTRVRLLALLTEHELTVAELTEVTQLPQPRVSTHLRRLRDSALVRDRRVGSSSYYSADDAGLTGVWKDLVRTTQDPLLAQDLLRVPDVLAARSANKSWADTVAGSMARRYSPGRTWESLARGLVGLTKFGQVVDIASGDGALAELIAPHAQSVVCVDHSERVVHKAQQRVEHFPNLRFVQADMHELPFPDGSFDHALLLGTLSYSADPDVVVREAHRVLKPGGHAVLVTLRTHEHHASVAPYDHVHMGFEPDELRALLEAAGLTVHSCAVTARERRPPHFEVLTAHATRP